MIKPQQKCYELNVICTNCGRKDVIKVPFGQEFKGRGCFGSTPSDQVCNKCGCATLINEDW
jgi:hypothetical protein